MLYMPHALIMHATGKDAGLRTPFLLMGTPGDELKSGDAQNAFPPQVYPPLGLLIAAVKSVGL